MSSSERSTASHPASDPFSIQRPRWRRWRLTKLHRRFAIRAAAVAIIIVLVLAAPLLTSFDPERYDVMERLQPVGTRLSNGRLAILGTDQLGRDIFTRILYGGRVSLLISISGVALAASLGVTIGLLAGYGGKLLDTVAMRIVDIQLGFPGLLLAILLAAVLGPSVVNVIIALGIARWTTYARVVRGSVLTLKNEDFVHAAQVIGASPTRIAVRHILPNLFSSIIVIAALHLGQMILAESALSFLGLGVPPPTSSWGSMINEGRDYITSAWWLITFPGLAITLTVLAMGLLGDAIRDIADPHLRSGSN